MERSDIPVLVEQDFNLLCALQLARRCSVPDEQTDHLEFVNSDINVVSGTPIAVLAPIARQFKLLPRHIDSPEALTYMGFTKPCAQRLWDSWKRKRGQQTDLVQFYRFIREALDDSQASDLQKKRVRDAMDSLRNIQLMSARRANRYMQTPSSLQRRIKFATRYHPYPPVPPTPILAPKELPAPVLMTPDATPIPPPMPLPVPMIIWTPPAAASVPAASATTSATNSQPAQPPQSS